VAAFTAVQPFDAISTPSSKPPAPAGSIKVVCAVTTTFETKNDVATVKNRKNLFIELSLLISQK
jgi:hypothetical protein